jgi:succinate dehydrogenase/fumarate reductase flavoprotein subunit
MAFRAGAELHGMEFIHPQSGWFFDRKYNAQGLNMFMGSGAQVVNRLGERFMEKYDPVLKERARINELCLAFAKEGVEGRGPVYLDMTHFSPETWERIRRVVPIGMRIFDESGLEPWKQKVRFDIGAGAVTSQVGGVKNNIFCETNLSGLYVAGQEGGYLAHGTFAVGGVNLAMCCVGGRRAGEYAARYSQRREQVANHPGQIEALSDLAFSPLAVKDGVTPDEVDFKIAEVIHSAPHSFFRHEKRIKTVLSRLGEIKALLPQLRAPDYHELVKANEMKNYWQCIELMNMAALERQESRGPLNREDFPYRDDINWLKRIILRRGEDGKDEVVNMRLEPIPIYRYPIRPEKFERIPARIATPEIDWGEE